MVGTGAEPTARPALPALPAGGGGRAAGHPHGRRPEPHGPAAGPLRGQLAGGAGSPGVPGGGGVPPTCGSWSPPWVSHGDGGEWDQEAMAQVRTHKSPALPPPPSLGVPLSPGLTPLHRPGDLSCVPCPPPHGLRVHPCPPSSSRVPALTPQGPLPCPHPPDLPSCPPPSPHPPTHTPWATPGCSPEPVLHPTLSHLPHPGVGGGGQ